MSNLLLSFKLLRANVTQVDVITTLAFFLFTQQSFTNSTLRIKSALSVNINIKLIIVICNKGIGYFGILVLAWGILAYWV